MMIDIRKLFGEDDKQASDFYKEENTLSPEERLKLHQFFEGTYKTTTVAKSFMGISTGLTMVWLARRKRRINPLYAMLGGFGISAFVYSFMTPTIYNNKVKEFEQKVGKESKLCRVLKVTPEPAEYSYYWSEYFEKSISDKDVRMKDPAIQVTAGSEGLSSPTSSFGNELIDQVPVSSPDSAWEKIREAKK